jgi:magnesium transporter
MEIFLYRKGAEKVEEGFTRDDLPALLADETNVVWVDLQGETEEHRKEAEDVFTNIFNFHHLTIEDCFETRNQPKVEAFEKYLYFIVHGIKPGETNAANFVTKELDGYLGSNFVVTFHTERFRSIKTVKQQIRSSTFVTQRGAAYLLQRIFDEIVDLYMPVVDDFDRSLNLLEERVFDMKRNNNEIMAEIMNIRRSVARMRRISARQLEVLYRISHGEFPQIPERTLPFYRDVHDHLVRITDVAENYRDLVSGLFDIHFSVIATRTNDVMKTLAVVSAIILPLSLIAGIYGMNFKKLPGDDVEYGLWITVAAMVAITIVLLIYFWRRGWIFQGDADIELGEPTVEEDFKEN